MCLLSYRNYTTIQELTRQRKGSADDNHGAVVDALRGLQGKYSTAL